MYYIIYLVLFSCLYVSVEFGTVAEQLVSLGRSVEYVHCDENSFFEAFKKQHNLPTPVSTLRQTAYDVYIENPLPFLSISGNREDQPYWMVLLALDKVWHIELEPYARLALQIAFEKPVAVLVDNERPKMVHEIPGQTDQKITSNTNVIIRTKDGYQSAARLNDAM